MPRFRVLALGDGRRDIDAVLHAVQDQFPEVSVEPDRPGGDQGTDPVDFTCRAPSEAHVRRCLSAAGILVRAVERW